MEGKNFYFFTTALAQQLISINQLIKLLKKIASNDLSKFDK